MRNALCGIVTTMIVAGVCVAAERPDDLQIWQSFCEALRSGQMSNPDRYRPLRPELRQPLMDTLEKLRGATNWTGAGPKPEVFHVGNLVHYIVPLTFQSSGGSTFTSSPFCFTLVLEGDHWYFQHLENILVRLDKIGEPPASSFPDLPDERKAWMRDEFQTTKDVRLFAYLTQEKGKEFAFDWFRDGLGYAIQAQTWVPFVSPERAFILYLCWDLANLRDEPVVLEKLTEEEARVRFSPRAFALYERTGHLKQQISLDDYRRLFEVVWLDRARNAGWNLQISYPKGECVFSFLRQHSQSGPEAKGAGDR